MKSGGRFFHSPRRRTNLFHHVIAEADFCNFVQTVKNNKKGAGTRDSRQIIDSEGTAARPLTD
ncbi:hypothetical protein SCOCK_490006 [Actinacidiphila cocklensis]|uniref:Uncharacterized protein n=1 Tax=Actinacidiphila cocklensis TaxID=887465 RepID=A0A9W4GU30_9ACTN|nr:hypothetical protein SCOCK_490006 [Actinacidiphila cocklensis]